MKIGIVCYPTYGGSGVVATELGKALADKGHSVHFISYKQPFRIDFFSSNMYYHEVNISNYPLFDYAPYETVLASKLVDVIKYEKLDLVHVHYAIPHASAAYLAKQILKEQGIHIPVVTTLHGTDITLVGKDATFAPVVTFSINHSDGVTAVSQNLKEDTLRYFKVEKEIEVIPNFIDFDRFSKTNKEHFKKAIAPEGERILIHISNFRKVKRVRDVILIYQKVIEQIPAKLLLVGDGPDRTNAEQLCRELGICNGIRFLGKQDAVEELLAISDLFLMPSGSESFGLAALEAMACQVPVISSDIGGIPEINVHGVTGFMSSVGDVKDMARNAIFILSSEERLQQFKANAYQQAQKFKLENILPMYERFYEKVIEGIKEPVA
ncbi:MAG: N-acetyl-alpha-D-glucosaminyl L-malate synthase BshA [Chitinophagales bacterium]|nr:N-acetyl-alpha-D-glucosaminyl L-malate synthase BshA [Chitinophagales bacterium]